MKLDEAKQILKKNGYLLEDTEDDELDAVDAEYRAEYDKKSKDFDVKKADKLRNRYAELYDKHDDLSDKVKSAKLFNLKRMIDHEGFVSKMGLSSLGTSRVLRVLLDGEPFEIYGYINDKTGKPGFKCYYYDHKEICYSEDDVIKLLFKFAE